MLWLGIFIGFVAGVFAVEFLPAIETLIGLWSTVIESKKAPYVKEITDANLYAEGPVEKAPAIGFDISPYIDQEEADD